jgi:23S rRNA (guanosine2251-2'-O)-methyltransferase
MKPLRPPPHTRGLPQHRQRRSGPRPMTPSAFGVAGERWIYGRHAVAAALANPARRWHHLAVLSGQESEASTLLAAAAGPRRGDGAPLRVVDHDSLAAILPEGAVHQGLALAVEPLPEPDLADVLRFVAGTPGRRVIVVLDQVTDPRNVGAVLRSAAAFGAFAVVLAVHGAPPVTGALAKAASGALEQVPLVRVVNLARALDRLKQSGFWVCGLEANAQQTLADLELGHQVAVVLGSEGGGMRRLVRERCDHLARLPTRSAQATLNVSSAAAIALYELARDQH